MKLLRSGINLLRRRITASRPIVRDAMLLILAISTFQIFGSIASQAIYDRQQDVLTTAFNHSLGCVAAFDSLSSASEKLVSDEVLASDVNKNSSGWVSSDVSDISMAYSNTVSGQCAGLGLAPNQGVHYAITQLQNYNPVSVTSAAPFSSQSVNVFTATQLVGPISVIHNYIHASVQELVGISKGQSAAQSSAGATTKAETALNLVLRISLDSFALLLFAFDRRAKLAELIQVSRRAKEGDLTHRSTLEGKGEIAELSSSLNLMLDALAEREKRLSQNASEQDFDTGLIHAMELADTEADVAEVTFRALVAIEGANQAEVLLADSSEAHMRRLAVHAADMPAPECGVELPWQCAALRLGRTQRYSNSEAIDACPKLRDRSYGACAALCTPVSFMGKALGVIHVVGPPSVEIPSVHQFATLASAVGTKLGMLRQFEASQRQAETDGLTGLINRRTFENRLTGFSREGNKFLIVFSDLDNFKILNDTHGHEEGDRALRNFAAALQESIRPGDFACRYGGEEFVIAVKSVDLTFAGTLVKRISASLNQYIEGGSSPRFSASYGAVVFENGDSLTETFRMADRALYRAKNGGRNRLVGYDALMGEFVEVADNLVSSVISHAQSKDRINNLQNGDRFRTGWRSEDSPGGIELNK